MAQSDPIFIWRPQIQLGSHSSREGFKAGFGFQIVYLALFVSLWEETCVLQMCVVVFSLDLGHYLDPQEGEFL